MKDNIGSAGSVPLLHMSKEMCICIERNQRVKKNVRVCKTGCVYMQIQQQRFQMEVQNWLRCVVRAQHQQAYPKRRIDMKRDLQKRPTKETFLAHYASPASS